MQIKSSVFPVEPAYSENHIKCLCCEGNHVYGIEGIASVKEFVSDMIYEMVKNNGVRCVRVILQEVDEAEQSVEQTGESLA